MKQVLGVGTLEGQELRGANLDGRNLPGGSQSFLVTHTSMGVTRRLFGLYRLQKTSKGYLGPRRILMCTA